MSQLALYGYSCRMCNLYKLSNLGDVFLIRLRRAINHNGREPGAKSINCLFKRPPVIEVKGNGYASTLGKIPHFLCQEVNIGVDRINDIKNHRSIQFLGSLYRSPSSSLIVDIRSNDTIAALSRFPQYFTHGHQHRNTLLLLNSLST